VNIHTPACVQQPKQLDAVFIVLMRGPFPAIILMQPILVNLHTCYRHIALQLAQPKSCVLEGSCMPVNVASNAEVAHRGPAAVQAIADLFAPQRIHQDILFRNDDYVAPEKAKAIKRMIEKLCSELRGVCCPLVDAFAIPDFILRAPIGLSTAAKGPYAA